MTPEQPTRKATALAGLGARGLLRLLLRESRGNLGRLVFFVLCLSVGVAAVVAVKSLSASLDRTVRSQARELIAADILVSARRQPEIDIEQVLGELQAKYLGLEVAPVREMLSVVASQKDLLRGSLVPGLPVTGLIAGSQTVELKAVSAGYPFYGSVDVDPPSAVASLFNTDGSSQGRAPAAALVAPELLERLDLEVGEALLVGGSPFEIVGVIRSEPDRLGGSLSIGPRVLVSVEALARTRALTDLARVSYSVQVMVPETVEVDVVAEDLRARFPAAARIRVETFRDARPELRQALDRVSAFLSLVALLSLLVGGVGVSQTVRAWLATRWDQIAILKSLGTRPREVLVLYLSQIVLLAVSGSAVGALVGGWFQLVVPRFVGDVVPIKELSPWQAWPIAQGMLLGIVVALAFSVPALVQVLQVPAARVLRRDSQPLARSRWSSLGLGLLTVAVVFLVASVQAVGLPLSPFLVGGAFTGLLLLTVLCLVGASMLLIRIVGLVGKSGAQSAWRVAARYGVASVARPGSGTLSAIVALGLGILVVLTMVLVQGALTDRLQADLPTDAPSMFLMGIEDEQWPQLEDLLGRAGRPVFDPATVTGVTSGAVAAPDRTDRTVRSVAVLATLVEYIDGETLAERSERAKESGREWATRRQLRVTPLKELPANNVLTQGRWFKDDGVWEASLEREYAEALGVGIGSTLDLRVGEQRQQFVITSLRDVQWENFSINFWVVIERGAFVDPPVFRLATVRAAREQEQAIQDATVAEFPNVTVIRIRDALDRVVEIFARLGFGIQFLGGFTVISGLIILAGAVAATAAQRGREAALLKALGMQRGQVLVAFATEYALLGLVASTVAVLGAVLVSWVAARFLMEIEWTFRPVPVLIAVGLGVGLAVLGGTAASFGALRRRPIEALRFEG